VAGLVAACGFSGAGDVFLFLAEKEGGCIMNFRESGGVPFGSFIGFKKSYSRELPDGAWRD
jgi:hypothetical protein